MLLLSITTLYVTLKISVAPLGCSLALSCVQTFLIVHSDLSNFQISDCLLSVSGLRCSLPIHKPRLNADIVNKFITPMLATRSRHFYRDPSE
ncbi:hypothetical protein F5Y14DRAFT_182323 [Nemania sp. NC0429]|nr:hypothetical protein F5Y14DRAFT_182323 [Nemania sp. NC0429]